MKTNIYFPVAAQSVLITIGLKLQSVYQIGLYNSPDKVTEGIICHLTMGPSKQKDPPGK